MKDIFYTIIAVVLIVAAFEFGRIYGEESRIPDFPEKVDTLFIHDTVRVSEPSEIAPPRTIHDTVKIPVAEIDTLYMRDTLYLPRVQKQYGDTTYTAWVSGVDPRLDSILVFPVTKIVTRQVKVKVPSRWGVGVQSGVGVTAGSSGVGISPYIGVGVQYSLFSW